MNEQLKGFLKKASEDGPLKEELGALAGLPEEELRAGGSHRSGSRFRCVGRGLRSCRSGA